MVRLTDRPDMTLDVYGGRKTTIQQPLHIFFSFFYNYEYLCSMPDFSQIYPVILEKKLILLFLLFP